MSEWTIPRRAEAAARRTARRPRDEAVLPGALGSLFLLFVAFPIVALIWRAATSGDVAGSLTSPLVLRALTLTAATSAITLLLALVLGTPLAWVLARRSFRGRMLVETLVDLPLVLPPVVAGVALLMAFGRRGLLGGQLELLGIELPFTAAAVVLAQLFISAPFYVRGAMLGFRAVPREVEEAAAIDGAAAWATFRHVTLPLALPGLTSGAVLCWARAVSEFGATLMFAGNISGRTQTMSLAIMSAMETSLGAALALALLLTLVAIVVLLAARTFGAVYLGRS